MFIYQSNDNTITGNSIKNADFDGLQLFVVDNSLIKNNDFLLNGGPSSRFAIFVQGNGNIIYHNNFMANNDGFNQVSEAGTNSWYVPFTGDLKVSGGNYWDDDITPGNPWCPDADVNGLCDVPHLNGIIDLHPFVSPDGWWL